MTDLIARLREAKEGSRELDAAVCVASGYLNAERARVWSMPVTTDLSAAVALAERVLGIVRMKWVFQDALDAWQPKDGVPAFVLQFVAAILLAKEDRE